LGVTPICDMDALLYKDKEVMDELNFDLDC